MKIAVIGGGPGGLYFSMLAKYLLPNSDVHLYEQNSEGSTFGFGVALHGTSWDFMRSDSESCLRDIVAASKVFKGQNIVHRGEKIYFSESTPNAGISRVELLRVLKKHAQKAGVKFTFAERIGDLSPFDSYDLVVGADGVNSIVRNSLNEEFGTTQRILTSRMAWYGITKEVSPSEIVFKKTNYGWFWYVAYVHGDNVSTFVAECGAKAFKASGLDKMSMEEQVAFTENVFAEELGGARILSNNSTWRALPVTRVKNWSVGKYVLIGDALHSPHPSIGSGTRLSMSDASSLASALSKHPNSVKSALEEFRATREPSKQKLVDPMERSLEWYEDIEDRLDTLSPVELTFDWMGRTGRMSLERLKEYAPEFYERYANLAPAGYE